ncbi:hypothetical protein BH09GEM1_BH09GEM1_37590 [soil metagenome]
MKERDRIRAERLNIALQSYAAEQHALAGVFDPVSRAVFVRQLIDSLHRVEYPRRMIERRMSVRRTDPIDEALFDPIKGAVYYATHGNHDEACWLVFLFVTYGKGKQTGWRLIRDVYGRLGQGGRWDWSSALADPAAMVEWVTAHGDVLWPKGTPRPFGAHRQHERIVPSAHTMETYLRWIGAGGHRTRFDAAATAAGGDRRLTFDILYREMAVVYRYGRLAKFDYLAMLGKLDLAAVAPGSTYMTGATGPVSGARLLLAGDSNQNLSPQFLDEQLADLDVYLGVGMQALEDALCNWQKSPSKFKSFRG